MYDVTENNRYIRIVVAADLHFCPDGVEVRPWETVDGSSKAVDDEPEPNITYKSVRRAQRVETASSLENPTILQFVNLQSQSEMLGFYSLHGLPFPILRDWPLSAAWTAQAALLGHLRLVAGGNEELALSAAGGMLAKMPLRARLAPGHRQWVVETNGIENFMWLEAVLIAQQGCQLRKCENDGRYFLVGPSTGRRGHAKYCSDRCRVAALRARSKATSGSL